MQQQKFYGARHLHQKRSVLNSVTEELSSVTTNNARSLNYSNFLTVYAMNVILMEFNEK